MAAMSRADIAGEERTPFYLYVDEFQNFATDSFATILSEARKYGLNLTVANQYTAQMMQEVKDAVFGNVGSIISFRTSADDARVMMKYFEPKFEEHDLVHMHNRHFAISMTIGGEKVPAFSAISLNLPPFGDDYTPQIIAHSRAQYAQTRDYIERYVAERYLTQDNANAKQTEPKMTKPKPVTAPPRQQAPKPAPRPLPAAEPALALPIPAVQHPDAEQAKASKKGPVAMLSQAILKQIAADADAIGGGDKPKRKRTRKRKRKTATSDASAPAAGPSSAQSSEPNAQPSAPRHASVRQDQPAPKASPKAAVQPAEPAPTPKPVAPKPQPTKGVMVDEGVIRLN
jgi:hypothetical protein